MKSAFSFREWHEVQPSSSSRGKWLVWEKVVVEIKPYQQKKYEVNIAKWKSAMDYCNEKGYGFMVLTERELY